MSFRDGIAPKKNQLKGRGMGFNSRGGRVADLIDPVCVQDTFCEGVAEIERIGDACVRVTMFVTRSIGGGEYERVVVARIVLPKDAFERATRQCESFTEGQPLLTDDSPENVRAN